MVPQSSDHSPNRTGLRSELEEMAKRENHSFGSGNIAP